MPEFIEIKDEVLQVSSIVRMTTDLVGNDNRPVIRLITHREDYMIFFDDEESCKEAYLKARDILLKNTQKLNS